MTTYLILILLWGSVYYSEWNGVHAFQQCKGLDVTCQSNRTCFPCRTSHNQYSSGSQGQNIIMHSGATCFPRKRWCQELPTCSAMDICWPIWTSQLTQNVHLTPTAFQVLWWRQLDGCILTYVWLLLKTVLKLR